MQDIELAGVKLGVSGSFHRPPTTGCCDAHSTSGLGQKHALPHCKTDDCFAPGKQTSGFLFTIVTV